MKQLAIALLFPALLLLGVGCNSTKQATEKAAEPTTANTRQEGGRGGEGQRPQGGTPEERFAQMDTNKDGKLAASEVKGPLKESFSTIDTDGDGFISLEEMKKAPRPERQGPPPGGGRPGGGK